MSNNTLRLLGILCLLAAVVLAILNLKRVANLGTVWVSTPLLLAGIILITRARRRG